MADKNSPIGILDSGVGGLTVIKAIKQLMPQEDTIFFADSLNCPYGNKNEDEIANLTNKIIDFLKTHNIKIVAIACNTMSAIIEQIRAKHDIEIIGIISPTAEYICKLNLSQVGLIATSFTIKSNRYKNLLQKSCKDLKLISQDSKVLAKLIEDAKFNEIDNEIKIQIDTILEKTQNLQDIILGCTHYPIVENSFKNLYPNISFINPAIDQANAVREFLAKNHMLTNKNSGDFKIYTSGNINKFETFLKKLNLPNPNLISYKKI